MQLSFKDILLFLLVGYNKNNLNFIDWFYKVAKAHCIYYSACAFALNMNQHNSVDY